MKKYILPAIGLLASILTAQAQVFTNTNVLVLRISGNVSSSGAGAAIFIDEFQTNAVATSYNTPAYSFAVPTAGANSILNVGLAYAGLMTMTPSATNVVFAGYNVALGASFAASTAGELVDSYSYSVPRSIASLDAYGNFSVPIQNVTNFNTYTIIGAASDGTNYWMSGNGPPSEFIPGSYPEVVYCGTAGTQTQVEVATNTFSSTVRAVNVFYNTTAGAYNLFVSGTSTNTPTANIYHGGTFVLSNISGVLPETQIGASNYFPDASAAGATTAAYDIAINPAGTIAYMADNDWGIIKYTFVSGAWTSNYNIWLTNAGYLALGTTSPYNGGATSVAVDWSQSPPVVYATTAEAYTNRLVRFRDTNASGQDTVINMATNATPTTGSGGVTNTFRGVRFGLQQYAYISVPPLPFAGNPGDTATFSATVLGSPTPTLQWYSNSTALPNTWVAISGATTATLTLHNITQAQSGSEFYLQAVNTYGSSTNTPVALTVQNPAISVEPEGATNLLGSSGVTLSVTALGTGTLAYQWFANGVAISGANSPSYTVPSSPTLSDVTYYVIVTNTVGATKTTATSSSTVVSYTPYLLYDTFTYANGNLFGDSGSPWTEIAGSTPEEVISDTVQVSQANATSEGQSLLLQTESIGSPVMWYSFTIDMQSLPTNAGGTYFAALVDTNHAFTSCVYALTSNAFPGTYRLGIANTNLDYASGNGGPDSSGIIPVDLATNTTYQVVVACDSYNGYSYLGINPNVTSDVDTPSFESDATTVYAGDDNFPKDSFGAFGLRQAAGEGIMQLDNLEVSLDTTIGDATICGYCAVTAGITPLAPTIGLNPVSFTNYTGTSNTMEVAASAIGSGISPTYTWYKNNVAFSGDGGDVSGTATAALTINPLEPGDDGNYYVIVSNGKGSAQSATAVVYANAVPTPPFFITPTSATTNIVEVGSSVTFNALANGSSPITYEWWFNNGSGNADTHVSGPTLALSSLATNQSGIYTVVATGADGSTTSPDFDLTVTPPIVTNIAYLNSLLNTSAAPTLTLPSSDTNLEYTVTGVVTVATNLSTSAVASYYLQDSTGGINFFVEDGTFRPAMGDVITVTGVLSLYYDTLQLTAFTDVASETYSITGGSPTPTNEYPITPKVFPLGYAQSQPALTALNYLGSFVMLTNVYFEGAGGVFVSETSVTITNQAGVNYGVVIYPLEYTAAGAPLTSIIGEPIPYHAYSVCGVLNEYSTTDFELDVTRYSDIVLTAPAPVTITNLAASVLGTSFTLTWTAETSASYSVVYSTNVSGPYSDKLATGLTFGNTQGTYTGSLFTNVGNFYEVTSP